MSWSPPRRRWLAQAHVPLPNLIEREDKERTAKRREWDEEAFDQHDPYAEDILVDTGSASVVIRDLGEV